MKGTVFSGRKSPVKISLNAACVAASVVFTAVLILMVTLIPGSHVKAQTSSNLGVVEKYQMEVTNRISDALEGVASIKKQYWISEDALTGPLPDPKRYGETDDPTSLQWLLDEAEELLEGQELFFSTDVEIMPGSTVHYYLDDTILAITWKQAIHFTAFTFSEVKLVHPSQFRRFLSGGEFSSGKLFLTTEMAESVNAVVACSADYYAYRTAGITVTDGVVRKANSGVPDTCYIDENGDMILVRGQYYTDMEDAQRFVDENHIKFSLSFGPVLVQDGERIDTWEYPLGEVSDNFTRAALCQMGKLHYLFAAANIEGECYHALTIYEFAARIAETGCIQGYTVDGGQTATVVMNNELINNVNYGSQRRISDIIYFATAKPMEE